jgi:hypothetical protein
LVCLGVSRDICCLAGVYYSSATAGAARTVALYHCGDLGEGGLKIFGSYMIYVIHVYHQGYE